MSSSSGSYTKSGSTKSKERVGRKVIRDTYKGNPTIGIWDVDAKGNTVGKAPVISFGYNKAKAILDHIDEIQEWAADQEEAKELAAAESASTAAKPSLRIEDLSPADLAAIQALLNKSKSKN